MPLAGFAGIRAEQTTEQAVEVADLVTGGSLLPLGQAAFCVHHFCYESHSLGELPIAQQRRVLISEAPGHALQHEPRLLLR